MTLAITARRSLSLRIDIMRDGEAFDLAGATLVMTIAPFDGQVPYVPVLRKASGEGIVHSSNVRGRAFLHFSVADTQLLEPGTDYHFDAAIGDVGGHFEAIDGLSGRLVVRQPVSFLN